MSELSEKPAQWKTNLIVITFLAAYTSKYLLISSQNLVEVSKKDSTEKVPFDHPFFQMVAAYVGELIFTVFYYLYKAFVMKHQVRQSEIRFLQFIYPAFCDFMENLLFIFGLASALPAMSMLTKAFALPVSALLCRWSFFRIGKSFNKLQVISLVAACIACIWIFAVSIDPDYQFFTREQTLGFTMLGLSAIFQASEICLENRLFIIEKDLSALALQQAVSIWKIILVVIMFSACLIFPEALGKPTGADIESLTGVVRSMNVESVLYWYMIGISFFNGLAANLGMQIIKDENAVFKQSAILLAIPILWLYHMQGKSDINEDKFTVAKLLGQIMLVCSVLFYMWVDRRAVAEQLQEKKERKQKDQLNRRPATDGDAEDPYNRNEDSRNLVSRLPTTEMAMSGGLASYEAPSRRKPAQDNKELQSSHESSAPEHSDEEVSSSRSSGRPRVD